MFANFLIGLREGLEAALVVGILVAYIVKSDRRDRLPAIWMGVGLAVVASLAVGAALTFTSRSLTPRAQEAFGGVMSLIAVAFVTWMIFWMRAQSRHLKAEMHGRLDSAVANGALAMALVAFLAVAREGLETALFLWPALQSAGSGVGPGAGAMSGLITAAVLGYLVYNRAVNLDLAKFFRITGAGLIIIAAGVLAYGFHDLQEASIVPGLGNIAFDISAQLPPSSWYGSLLKGIFNLNPRTTWLEVVVWFAYLVPTTILFFRPLGVAPASAPAPIQSHSSPPN